MSVEAYTVGYEKANFHAPVDPAFNREEVLQAREAEIVDNLLSYVGEYRLGVKFDEFFYDIGEDLETGERFLMSKEKKPIRETYRNAIRERDKNGLSTRREVAECLGFEKLEKELLESEEGAMAVWVSPPGEKEDGYGGYSFTFVGQVVNEEGRQRIRMIPYRNEMQISDHNKYLSEVAGRQVNFGTDVEFLYNPVVFNSTEDISSPDDVFDLVGEKEEFDNSWRDDFLRENWSLIQHFLYQVRNNYSDSDLVKTRNAIEFCALEYKRRMGEQHTMEEGVEAPVGANVQDFIDKWGSFELPKVGGSCGLSGADASDSSTPMEFQNIFGKKWEYHKGDCVVCKTRYIQVGPCNICKECEKKFDDEEL